MDMSKDTKYWNEIATSLMTKNCSETKVSVPYDHDSASMVSDIHSTNSLVQQQLASDENSTYTVEQSSIQHNIENGLSATNLQHSQINPYFDQRFNQWYSNSNDVSHPTYASSSTTDPYHHQSNSSESFYQSSGNNSEPIGNTCAMENYSAAYGVYNQHLEPFNGAVCDTHNYYSNNFPLHPEQSVIQPTNVQSDVQISDQQQMNKKFNDVNEYQLTRASTEFSTTLKPNGKCNKRSQWKEKVHKCEVCYSAYTTRSYLKRHFNTNMHLHSLKLKASRSSRS